MTRSALRRAEVTAARLAALPGAGSGAEARLIAMGLPLRRDEYWSYTDPAPWLSPDVAPVAADSDASPFDAVEADRVDLIDGALGAAPMVWGAGVERVPFDAVPALEPEAHVPVARPFATLVAARPTATLALRVTGVATRPVHLRHRADGVAEGRAHLRLRLEPGASLTLIESGLPAARGLSLIEADIAEGASLHILRDATRGGDRPVATHLVARLGARASLRSFTLSAGARMARHEAFVTLDGEHGTVHLAGASLGGPGTHHDDTVFITHAAPHCESRQVFKKVLRGGAVGVFQGKILVKQVAQKTDGYQKAQGLLLDEASQFLAKPELEIYADDVACSHGATAGALDETALFYLRSRGVPAKAAADLLTLSFLREAFDEIADEALADALADRLAEVLAT